MAESVAYFTGILESEEQIDQINALYSQFLICEKM